MIQRSECTAQKDASLLGFLSNRLLPHIGMPRQQNISQPPGQIVTEATPQW